jgi:hypothetical protein
MAMTKAKALASGTFFSLFFAASLWAQAPQAASYDTTVFQIYHGQARHAYYLADNDSTQVKDGKFSFRSEMTKLIEDNEFVLREIWLDGQYEAGNKQGKWECVRNDYILSNISLQTRPPITARHQLGGTQDISTLNYRDGRRHGTWTSSYKTIHPTRRRHGAENLRATLNFNDDTLSGSFIDKRSLEHYGETQVAGRANEDGFLDGPLTLRYMLPGSSMTIVETRLYSDGFLLQVTRSDAKQDTLIEQVVFDDVAQALDRLRNEQQATDYKASTLGFGLVFNNGYASSDRRRTIQEAGNDLLRLALGAFDDWDALFRDTLAAPVYNLTRRFQFRYPEYEDSLGQVIKLKAGLAIQSIDSLLKMPKLQLRKENSDELEFVYAFSLHVKGKVERILEAVERTASGYFDFRRRDSYYPEGIEGLNRPDTIHYTFKGKPTQRPFREGKLIDSPHTLFLDMNEFLDSLELKMGRRREMVEAELESFENQDFVDSLDAVIIQLSAQVAAAYDSTIVQARDAADIPFHHKLHQSFQERLIRPNRSAYLANSASFEETVTRAQELICVLGFLVENEDDLVRVENLNQQWDSEVFTIYRENPFDFRQFEAKILPGIREASTILLRHYATNLLNVRNCKEAHVGLDDIKRLEERVLYFRNNYQNRNILLIDRSLRRERVPARIIRIMNL